MHEPVNVTLDVASYNMPVSKFLDWLRDGLGGEFEKVADDIEAQVNPAVEEPAEWGSLVLASSATCHNRVGWMRVFPSHKHYWENADGVTEAWTDLHRPEVLRVGIGEPVHEFMTSAGFDPTSPQDAAYTKGAADFAAKVRREVSALRSTVVTGPEKRTCDDALALVAALLGES